VPCVLKDFGKQNYVWKEYVSNMVLKMDFTLLSASLQEMTSDEKL